jgi:hypothetical protein
MLYRIIEIQADGSGSSSDTARHLLLYHTLQDIRFSQLVTEVHLTLKDDGICAKHIPSTFKWRSSSHRCSCSDYDQALGNALLCLTRLEILDLKCSMCRGLHFHDYLHNLEMPRLKGLRFRCHRSSPRGRAPHYSKSILAAPYMQNIHALALDCDFDWLCGNASGYKEFLSDVSIIPKLRTLRHNGRTFCNDLLAARPVERISVDHTSENIPLLHESIRRSPGKLSHLLMVDVLRWLPNSMEQDLEPYRHLRHIGTIAFPELQVFTLVILF